jgi:hypothetical protein
MRLPRTHPPKAAETWQERALQEPQPTGGKGAVRPQEQFTPCPRRHLPYKRSFKSLFGLPGAPMKYPG